ncbi:hypothetical protein [Aquamicrobium sp.]|uniref:hypothetical protein n=1 Tax=Aquamicrobium sp. TaxID=1872579 RepID=UPI00258A7900|nr:hypothetical protein [Aquamicrobium sp.]MCK9549568.1 hypothetical protein [Aquamicrobium sp.]
MRVLRSVWRSGTEEAGHEIGAFRPLLEKEVAGALDIFEPTVWQQLVPEGRLGDGDQPVTALSGG